MDKSIEGKATSLWMGTTPDTNYPALSKNIEVEVAIVGGGIAGINAGYFLTRAGKKVAVLEAFKIATGTSGFTTAKVTALHGLKYAYLKSKFGIEFAKIYGESNSLAIDKLRQIIKKEAISCDFNEISAYTFTQSAEKIKDLKEENEVLKEIGLPAKLLSKTGELPFAIKAAVELKGQAFFHPRKYLLALAQKIIKTGGQIYENSRVLKIDEDSGLVFTDKGQVKAKNIIIATNYPIYDKAAFFIKMNQMRSYALAARLKGKLPWGMYLSVENEESYRPHKSGQSKWLIIGGEEHVSGADVDTYKKYKNLMRLAYKKFEIKSVDYRWAAQDSSSIDKVPYIGKMPQSENIYVTTGFGEWGMTTSFVSAKILTDLILGRANHWSELYAPSRLKPHASVKKTAKHLKFVLKGFSDYILKNEKLKNLKPNQGVVITSKGQKTAVYKDYKGKLNALSAVCTHMGCIVDWNNAEKSWDCPCHGSRYTKEGEVINGPAVKSLEKKHLK